MGGRSEHFEPSCMGETYSHRNQKVIALRKGRHLLPEHLPFYCAAFASALCRIFSVRLAAFVTSILERMAARSSSASDSAVAWDAASISVPCASLFYHLHPEYQRNSGQRRADMEAPEA